MYKRKLDIALLVLMARAMAAERKETGVISVDPMGNYRPSVHVASEALCEVSIPDVWDWEHRDNPDIDPWLASVIIAGVVFFALFTDDERKAVIDGE